MNENIDLTKILKDCPEGTKLYTTIWGEVTFIKVCENVCNLYPIIIYNECDHVGLTKDGRYLINKQDSECILFPSKEQRDWSKFNVGKSKFDPTALKPFDKVLIKSYDDTTWVATLFSHIIKFHDKVTGNDYLESVTEYCTSSYCIPYNDDTKHLVGTQNEAPEYYKYWSD